MRKAGILIASLTLLVAGAGPAFAVVTNCPTTKSCTWGDSQYKTSGLSTAHKDFANYLTGFASAYPGTSVGGDNSASSTDNRSTSSVRYYDGVKCSGSFNTRGSGGQDSDFSNGDPVWDGTGTTVNDKYSSGAVLFGTNVANCQA
jgi:hypothetical protein